MIRVTSRFKFISCSSYASPPFAVSLIRRFALWSMKKDPDLELVLSHNHRWIVNNQIKNIILRYPNQAAPVDFIQKKFKTLDMQGKAVNWFNKYPSCFEVFRVNDVHYCRLTKRMMSLVEEEESVKEEQEPVFMERLAKILMMTTNKRLNVVKLDELKRNFGFPDDYLIRIVAKYSEMFRLVNYSGRKSSLEIELISWKPEFALSRIEMSACEQNKKPCFSCSLPLSWIKSWERFNEFNSTPYISPYTDSCGLIEGSMENDKRVIALVHELLSLSLWKKISIIKLTHFKREFALPDKLNVLLLKHPGTFYVTNKYRTYTVILREAYNGSTLIHKDPLVVVKEKFGEIMQEGLHEYNHRRRLLNLEKRNKKGLNLPKVVNAKDKNAEMSKEVDQASQHGGDVNAADHTGQTALHWSAVCGAVHVAELLMHEGTRVDAANMTGYQTTHVPAQFGQAAFLYHMVMKWNADPDVPDNDDLGNCRAAYTGFVDCIRFLLFLYAYRETITARKLRVFTSSLDCRSAQHGRMHCSSTSWKERRLNCD